MLDSPRSESPTSPTPEYDQKAWQCLYFCRFPGCNKAYASTDGVRKHCRKHHADWLAQLDEQMRENKQKHSAANYCSTEPAESSNGEFAAISHAPRKRQRADSGASTISTCTPNSTPRLDPAATPRRSEPPAFMIDGEAIAQQPAGAPPPTKEEIFNGMGWPTFDDDALAAARPSDAPDRPLLTALAALDERSSAWPHRGTREREHVSQNFFNLSSGMPVPKRGLSLTAEAMAELARECELEAQRGGGGCMTHEFADLNSCPLQDALDPPPEHETVGFVTTVWA